LSYNFGEIEYSVRWEIHTAPRDPAANLPSRIRPGDAYVPQMTRNPPESTGYDRK
jgi:hypothetical protein